MENPERRERRLGSVNVGMASMVRYGRLAGLSAAMLAALWSPALAQTADDLFNPEALQEIRLFINHRDLQELRTRYGENTYYPADLHWGAVRVRNAGVRSRGNGSRNSVKLGLHVDFNHYVARQELLGLKSIELDNLWQDASMIRDYAAMLLFARMGQPAPRVSFARLYINGGYQGVYGVVESIDARFLARALGEDDGALFEYRWIDQYRFEDAGTDLATLERRFERRNHKSDPASAVYAPLAAMIRAINGDDEHAWTTEVGAYVDLRQFLAHAATEQFLSELDGLIGYAGLNNFYLYRPAGSSSHLFVAWDRDHAFQEIDAPVFNRAEQNEMFRRALTHEDLRREYLDALERCATLAAADGWLEGVIVRAASLILDAAAEDPLEPAGDAARAREIRHLVDFARQRPAHVLAAVARARVAGR